jgi:hypothetical protein
MLLLFHNGHVVFGVQRKTWIAGVVMRIFEQGSTERLYEVSGPLTRAKIEVDTWRVGLSAVILSVIGANACLDG